jgi:hypothetical protein
MQSKGNLPLGAIGGCRPDRTGKHAEAHLIGDAGLKGGTQRLR